MKGYRVVFSEPFKVELEEFELRKPGLGEVLIESEFTLISTGTELTALTGDFPKHSAWSNYVRYPFIPGYACIGKIADIGSDVKGFEIGDRVAATTPHATYSIAKVDDLVKVPEEVKPEYACLHTIAAGVMNSVRLAHVSLGSSVVVVGLGLLGQMAILFSRLCGAYPVIAVDLSDRRLELAKLSGATATIKFIEYESLEGEVKRLTKNRMADIVFEVTGNPNVIPWAIKLTKKPLGRFIILSSPRGSTTLDFHDEVNSPSRVIIGTHFTSQPLYETPYNPWTRRRNTELFFDLLKAGIIDVSHFITHIYPWRKASEAYKMLLEDRTQALAVLLDFRV
ncbi:MAG: zinc-binding dehydrogenase [Candidatus Bathyarchaeia archaeon]